MPLHTTAAMVSAGVGTTPDDNMNIARGEWQMIPSRFSLLLKHAASPVSIHHFASVSPTYGIGGSHVNRSLHPNPNHGLAGRQQEEVPSSHREVFVEAARVIMTRINRPFEDDLSFSHLMVSHVSDFHIR
jgi:hypothetical protein